MCRFPENGPCVWRESGGQCRSRYGQDPGRGDGLKRSVASYLVNMEHIRTVNAVGFVMSDGAVLPVTRKYAEARKKYIDHELNGGGYIDNL